MLTVQMQMIDSSAAQTALRDSTQHCTDCCETAHSTAQTAVRQQTDR